MTRLLINKLVFPRRILPLESSILPTLDTLDYSPFGSPPQRQPLAPTAHAPPPLAPPPHVGLDTDAG
eukprot:8620274-Pyramimonas_sp.AAC.2